MEPSTPRNMLKPLVKADVGRLHDEDAEGQTTTKYVSNDNASSSKAGSQDLGKKS